MKKNHINDSDILTEFSIDDLLQESVCAWQSYFNRRPGYEGIGKEELLLLLGLAGISTEDGRIHPTVAGMLLFSERRLITKIFPKYHLLYENDTDPILKPVNSLDSESGTWSGNLQDFFFRINHDVTVDFRVPFRLKGMERIDHTILHEAAWEGIINALANADFNYGGVVIRKDLDSISFSNSGTIPVGKEQFLKGGISQPRNKKVLEFFTRTNLAKEKGTGGPLLLDVEKTLEYDSLYIDEDLSTNRTTITLMTKSKSGKLVLFYR